MLRERADAQLATLDARRTAHGRCATRADDAALDEQAWVFDAHGRAIAAPAGAPPAVERAADGARGRDARRPSATLGETCGCVAEPAYARPATRASAPSSSASRSSPTSTPSTSRCSARCCSTPSSLARGRAARPPRGRQRAAAGGRHDRAGARDWSEHDLDRRFELGPPRDELTALSATLDGLLGRIAASLRHEQRFSAEMAHELRTPLSGVRGEAELALRDDRRPTPRCARSLEQILRGTDRMEARDRDAARGRAPRARPARAAVSDAPRRDARPPSRRPTRDGSRVPAAHGRDGAICGVGADERARRAGARSRCSTTRSATRAHAVAVQLERDDGHVLRRTSPTTATASTPTSWSASSRPARSALRRRRASACRSPGGSPASRGGDVVAVPAARRRRRAPRAAAPRRGLTTVQAAFRWPPPPCRHDHHTCTAQRGSTRLFARDMLNKVPEVTLYFWVIKILCTTVGETAADYLNENLGLGLTNTTYVDGQLLADRARGPVRDAAIRAAASTGSRSC